MHARRIIPTDSESTLRSATAPADGTAPVVVDRRVPACTSANANASSIKDPVDRGWGAAMFRLLSPGGEGSRFPNHDVRIALTERQQQLQCPARRGLAGGIVHVPHGFEPSAQSEFHEPSLQTARDSGPPHRQVFTLSAVQPSRELTRRSRQVPCNGGDDDAPLRQMLIARQSLQQRVDHARGSATSADGNPSCARRAEGQLAACRASASSAPSSPDR